MNGNVWFQWPFLVEYFAFHYLWQLVSDTCHCRVIGLVESLVAFGALSPFYKQFMNSWSKSCMIITLLFHKQIKMRSGHNFAHATTAQLSWHVQYCDLIGLSESRWKQNENVLKISVMTSWSVCEMWPWLHGICCHHCSVSCQLMME